MAFEITSGKIRKAQKVVLYGPEGVGKTTFAAAFPRPLFIDTEGGTAHLDVKRLGTPTSWQWIIDAVTWIRDYPYVCNGTLVIDTADWAERLCIEHVCKKNNFKTIEDPGYGKGYVLVCTEFGRLLNLLSEVAERGVNVLVTAHTVISKFEQPDEQGAYDRWSLKLQDGKKSSIAGLLKEWADAVLFMNYKTVVIEDTKTKKAKARGGKVRVIYTTHAAAYDAKNRWGLADEIPAHFAEIAAHIPIPNLQDPNAANTQAQPQTTAPQTPAAPTQTQMPLATPAAPAPTQAQQTPAQPPAPVGLDEVPFDTYPPRLNPLVDLMDASGITRDKLETAMINRGIYPVGTPLEAYDDSAINYVMTNWDAILAYIQAGCPVNA